MEFGDLPGRSSALREYNPSLKTALTIPYAMRTDADLMMPFFTPLYLNKTSRLKMKAVSTRYFSASTLEERSSRLRKCEALFITPEGFEISSAS
jgi:hypothetical protein